MSFAVRLTGISKAFGAVQALQDVTLEVAPHTIHALVGENGAGKTTLMRILYGVLQQDAGAIEVGGKLLRLRSSAEANAAGVGMVSQHYGIISELTCLENLILGAEDRAFLKREALMKRAQELASKMNFRFEWDAPASTLSPAATQKLEILKLLWRRSRIMILDEPTAMLGPADADALFVSLGALVQEGATVVLVTHRLPEVMSYCSRVTVLRGGRRIGDMAVSDTSPAELAKLIVGENADALGEELGHPAKPARAVGEPVLQVRNLTVRDQLGHASLDSVSLEVRAGEIVGVAGVDGNGQRELLQAILGTSPAATGEIRLNGEEVSSLAVRERIQKGLRVIPEDRHAEGAIESWSLEENAALGLHPLAPLAKGGLIDRNERQKLSQRVVDRFGTKHGGLSLSLASLSGGNQQRLVAGRAFELSPKLLVAFQPARGLDLGGTASVYQVMRQYCDEGMGALVISFDLDEILLHCDRVVVLNGGHLDEPSREESKSRDAIGRLMVGVG
ncbi:MAG TPA: ATP-binding cassette domain-containing protein [Fimbriimonas sp.]|nr:ATP-binding cassette domain-containing protein [Fimbriimonas sp.]